MHKTKKQTLIMYCKIIENLLITILGGFSEMG